MEKEQTGRLCAGTRKRGKELGSSGGQGAGGRVHDCGPGSLRRGERSGGGQIGPLRSVWQSTGSRKLGRPSARVPALSFSSSPLQTSANERGPMDGKQTNHCREIQPS